MNIPADLKYTNEHEWLRTEDKTATIGITDWAQSELGDIVFIELPEVGSTIGKAQPFGTIEAVKAVSELFAPVTGTVVQINSALEDDPMAINRDAYGDGWMIKVELSKPTELDQLLDAGGYQSIIDG
ncbi:MAG: glycine cleavage system protein GcvH [candidate division Zixibacteria bacterium]|nr:glycine cleavage system protein GcvH [candidate division Zixibacteria bacterium]MDH3936297.1 glycine cleavage system protein GcvH [candidate division Zixibacteria bacterium]MDH4034701.1 glycine cleavage system protein GcvH [candidate division Zixibacteria bacterium]